MLYQEKDIFYKHIFLMIEEFRFNGNKYRIELPLEILSVIYSVLKPLSPIMISLLPGILLI